ncbi:DsbA family protein [Pseudoalteromonas porphyrae]|uniref:DsbA family protein n=1 Tax=Pseudoalteromonas porphyrae TaxID=187330 RepID=UPI00291C557C|nr:DsbA family protein [Pseudoalteromonas porphyrae]
MSDQTGAEFNFDFWRNCEPRRSTYPACRAVITARYFNKEHAMLEAIQKGYYLLAKNPSNADDLLSFAQQVGIDTNEFLQLFGCDLLNQEFQQELQFVQQLPVHGFPSLVLYYQNQYYAIAINYTNADDVITRIRDVLTQS